MKEILLNTVHAKSPNYKKYSALVDDEDFKVVSEYRWCVKAKRGKPTYAQAWVDGEATFMHNFLMNQKGIDHKDGNGLNNQRFNLRLATQHQNCMNKRKAEGCSSQYKGVSYYKATGKWVTRIQYDGKSTSIGYYAKEIDAAKSYNKKAKELFGEFAYLNKIPRNHKTTKLNQNETH